VDDEKSPAVEAEPEQGFIRELAQFFIIPSLIVLLCVAVFVMFGLISTESRGARDFLQQVRTSGGSDRWQAAFELSRAISAQPKLKVDDKLVSEIAQVIRGEGRDDPKVRKYLVIALENLGNAAAGPVLLESLADDDAEVRLCAARALSVIDKVPGSVAPLAGLLSDDDPAIRKMAVFALGRTGDQAAVAVLQPKLEDPVEDVRWNSALALAVLGNGSGVEVIAQMLDRSHLDAVEGITEEQKESALVNGVQAVYLLRDAGLVAKVRELSRNDPSLKVRGIALKALESIERANS